MSVNTVLTSEECMQLLCTGQVRRAAISTPMGPHVVSMNYVVYDGDIVVRTAPYSVLGTYGWEVTLPSRSTTSTRRPARDEAWSPSARRASWTGTRSPTSG
jgi:hypothetical protein